MPNLAMPDATGTTQARRVSGLARGIVVVLATALPSLYYWAGSRHAAIEMRAEAILSAGLISEFAVRYPDFWQYEQHRLRAVLALAAREGEAETWRVLDAQGQEVPYRHGSALAAPPAW